MKPNNRQLVQKKICSGPPPPTPQCGAVSTDLINLSFALFIYFIVEKGERREFQRKLLSPKSGGPWSARVFGVSVDVLALPRPAVLFLANSFSDGLHRTRPLLVLQSANNNHFR